MKFRSRPVEIEALQFCSAISIQEMREKWGLDFDRLHTWDTMADLPHKFLFVKSRNGWVKANRGDWVIKGDGEFYPCPPDVFERKYEPVEYPTLREDMERYRGDLQEDISKHRVAP